MTFSLESYTEYFAATVSGAKRHELRATKDVPAVKVGDILLLKERDPRVPIFTGRTVRVEVTYISPTPKPWLQPGYTLMSIRMVPWWKAWK